MLRHLLPPLSLSLPQAMGCFVKYYLGYHACQVSHVIIIFQMAFRLGRRAPWASPGRSPGASWVPVRGLGGRRGGPGGPGGARWVSRRVFWRSLGASDCVVKPTRDLVESRRNSTQSRCCFEGFPGCLAWLPVGPLGLLSGVRGGSLVTSEGLRLTPANGSTCLSGSPGPP